jgi:DNA-binding transcriptional MerR regulator
MKVRPNFSLYAKKELDPGIGSRVYNRERLKEVTSKQRYLRSGELARMAGVSPDTLRHYERKGLLTPPHRSANGYREYLAADLDRVRLVRGALGIGFTLDELARILKVRDRGGAPCHEVRALAGSKLSEVEKQLGELTELRDLLRGLLKNWDVLLARSNPSERAGLLETLVAKVPTRVEKTRTRSSRLAGTTSNGKKESKETQW